MRPIGQEAPVLRRSLLLIVGLIAVSTVLFVIGVTVERRGEATEGAGAHQELSSEPVQGAPVRGSPLGRSRATSRRRSAPPKEQR